MQVRIILQFRALVAGLHLGTTVFLSLAGNRKTLPQVFTKIYQLFLEHQINYLLNSIVSAECLPFLSSLISYRPMILHRTSCRWFAQIRPSNSSMDKYQSNWGNLSNTRSFFLSGLFMVLGARTVHFICEAGYSECIWLCGIFIRRGFFVFVWRKNRYNQS